MSEEKNLDNGIENVFDAKESIELDDFLNKGFDNIKSQTLNEPEKEKDDTSAKIVSKDEYAKTHKEVKSPLQVLKESKEQGKTTSGTIISNSDLHEEQLKADPIDSDRLKEFSEREAELDYSVKQRKALVMTKDVVTQEDFIKATYEVSRVNFKPSGEAYVEGGDVEPLEYFRLRTKEDGEYKDSELDIFERPEDIKKLRESENKENKETEKSEKDDAKNTEDTTENTTSKSEDDDEDKKKIVQIIIDKTGLGGNIEFTEDERKKLTESSEIQVTEVESKKIRVESLKRSKRSFQDFLKDYDYRGEKTTICFPASGFKAQMRGLSYGEYADVALSMDSITVDQYEKKLSVIYNAMKNISTGPFENFEDFLKHFAYTDIALALYGLFVSTEDEHQQIQIRCGNPNCKKTFDIDYDSRNLIKLDRCSKEVLTKMEELASAPASEYDAIKQRAVVNNSKFIELPDSKFTVELGIASAYDFLYNFVPLLDEETFKNSFDREYDETFFVNMMLLTSVISIRIPDGDDVIVCEGYKDIMDALYSISPLDIKIVSTYATEIRDKYEVVFSLGDVICPSCKNVTKNLDVSMDDIVFRQYQRSMSTEIKLKVSQPS